MKTLALLGNPNVGKTAVFNALTGLSQSTGNYPGVTVDRKYGVADLGDISAEILDLPGTYSLAARSPDEMIVCDVLLGQQAGEKPIDGLIIVVDASNIERNLFLVSQLLEMHKPAIVALNMMDIAERHGVSIDAHRLSHRLGLPVIPICAHKRIGVKHLKDAVANLVRDDMRVTTPPVTFPEIHEAAVSAMSEALTAHVSTLGRTVPRQEVFRILVDQGGYAERRLLRALGTSFLPRLEEFRKQAQSNGITLAMQEANTRYRWVRDVLEDSVTRPPIRPRTRSERMDDVLTHRWYGSIVFLLLMLLIFQGIYTLAAPIMDLVDSSMATLGDYIGNAMPEGMLRSLVVDGVVAGVGGVLIFLPQILILSMFIAILEDTGYMARAAFLMDKTLSWCGLSGHSFIPMMSSFACAIPGILSTRTIHDRQNRFATILIAPLMSCSARLPVYLVMISAFIPNRSLFGDLRIFNIQGITLFLMYCLGIVVAVPIAWIVKTFVFKGEKPPFILEMPTYKVPQAGTVIRKVYREGLEFLTRAGTLILAVMVLVWALAYFPHSESITNEFETQRTVLKESTQDAAALEVALQTIDNAESAAHLQNSILGKMGQAIEPAFVPLGWDWRIATAVIASFPAREIIIGTLGTLFSLGSDTDETSQALIDTLRASTWPDGRPLFSIPVALSIMVFFALCCQCGATLITIKRETKSWRWPVVTFSYMTILAYVAALVTYQVSRIIF